jgi:hypothetical protein
MKEIADLKSRYEKLKKSRDILSSNPEDGPGNYAVGEFQAILKGSWDTGLPLLAKGSDEAHRAAAARDLAAPTQADQQAACGDAWWDFAEKETGAARDNLRARAIQWYEKSQASLSGLAKTKVERRVSEVRLEKLNRGSWVDVTDSKLFGKTQSPLELVNNTRTPLLKMPAGTFDGLMVRVKIKGDGLFSVQYEPENRDMELNATAGHFSGCHLVANSWHRDVDVECPKKEEYLLAVVITDGESVFFMDGREMFRQQCLTDRVLGVQFLSWTGKIQFDQIKLRKKE